MAKKRYCENCGEELEDWEEEPLCDDCEEEEANNLASAIIYTDDFPPNIDDF